MTAFRSPIPEQIIRATETAYEHSMAVAALIVTDLSDAVNRYLCSYFATAIEIAGGCVVMARAGESIGIPILMRTMLEAWVDFQCLQQKSEYVEFIEVAHDHEWARVMDAAIDSDTEYLHKLGKEPTLLAERKMIAERLEGRRARGIRKMKPRERFDRAGMLDVYYSVYNFLCSEAHNDARALVGRHFVADDTEDLTLTLYRDNPPHVVSSLLFIHDVL